ncbi:Protein of unknown function (DUF1682) [Globodera pallida]|nr:Protein of unknown function (DUF1682) [Globodera pallida]
MSFSSTSVSAPTPSQSLTFIVFCLLFVPFAEACASNGVCGGGCCGPTCPPSPVSCNQASCQPGYTCGNIGTFCSRRKVNSFMENRSGHYGCARNKARSALTRKDGLIVPVDDFLSNQTQTPARNIYGFERRKTLSVDEEQRPPGTLDRSMYLKLTNPNFLFRQCCEDRRLPDTCLWKCHFNTYTKEVLQLMFFKNDPCPIEAAADLQYCAAQGRDHSECCTKVGIGKTVAGEKCLTFCDQRAGKLTKLDYSYLPCYDRFESSLRLDHLPHPHGYSTTRRPHCRHLIETGLGGFRDRIMLSLEKIELLEHPWEGIVQNGCSIGGDMPTGDVDGPISDNEFAEFEFVDEPSDDRESSVGQENRQQEAIFGDKSDQIEDEDIGGEEFGEKMVQHGEEDKSVRSGGEFSFLADEEEFEGFPARSDEAEQQQQKEREGAANKPPKPLTFAEVPSHFRSNWSSYQVELLALLVIFVYALNYAYGKSSNHAIAHKWFLDNRERLEKQFALVGDDGTSQENLGGCLIRETDFVYSVWCTGRVGCRALHTQIKLCKRQDLLGMVIGLFRPRPDHVVHKIDLDPDEMDSFVLIFGQRKSVQKTVKEMHDLSTYVTERKNLEKVQLPVSFCVFAEIAETIPAFIDTSTLQFLKKCEKFVEYIHFSDQYAGAKQPDDQYARLPETHPTMVFSYFVADENGSGDLVDSMLLNFTFFMLDKVRRYRLSREGKAKADKKRQNVQENFLKVTHQQRQEAAQTRREEKTRERKQRVMEEEDPDRQKRLEKLELKRDAKQKQPKMKQFKIK